VTYRALAESLRPVADAAAQFLRSDRGMPTFKVEETMIDGIDRPTLHAVARDHHFVCIEASERNGFQPSIEVFVNDCGRMNIPARLYIAVAAGEADKNFDKMLKRAGDLGIGMLEVDGTHVAARCEALSLSLQGLRKIDRAAFPPKYREALVNAEHTFLHGNPAKGCAQVYDELEGLSRRLAKLTYGRGLWKTKNPSSTPLALDFEKAPWASVMKALLANHDRSSLPTVTEPLIHGILAMTAHRNDTGHKIKRQRDLVKRDKQLRTRFEHAVDLFRDLVVAAKPFRI
jgi:hypothetical protein